MRDRLIELMKGAETKVNEMLSTPLALEEWLGIYADYLLENGVIVPHKNSNGCEYCKEHENAKVRNVTMIHHYDNPNAYGYPEVAHWEKRTWMNYCPVCGRVFEKGGECDG